MLYYALLCFTMLYWIFTESLLIGHEVVAGQWCSRESQWCQWSAKRWGREGRRFPHLRSGLNLLLIILVFAYFICLNQDEHEDEDDDDDDEYEYDWKSAGWSLPGDWVNHSGRKLVCGLEQDMLSDAFTDAFSPSLKTSARWHGCHGRLEFGIQNPLYDASNSTLWSSPSL